MQIEESFYKFRRLGMDDIADLVMMASQITTEGFQHLQIRLKFLRELGGAESFRDPVTGEYDTQKLNHLLMMLTLAFGVQSIKQGFYDLICNTLRHTDEKGKEKGEYVTLEEISDPEVFPAYSLAHLVLYLVLHPDFEILKNAVVEGSKIPFSRQILEDAMALAGDEMAKALQEAAKTEPPVLPIPAQE
jgi:hypothetical protein